MTAITKQQADESWEAGGTQTASPGILEHLALVLELFL